MTFIYKYIQSIFLIIRRICQEIKAERDKRRNALEKRNEICFKRETEDFSQLAAGNHRAQGMLSNSDSLANASAVQRLGERCTGSMMEPLEKP